MKPLDQPESVRLELFTNRLSAIADEMGEMLRRSAISTNVKERLDFSCALLDAHGRLAVNAPHIPVHLGALGLCVRSVAGHLKLQPGDVAVTNHPAFGGSHLPDVTVVTPIFDEEGALLGYAASRAHHAEIGGISPGSMPPDARSLAEEGVVIAPRLLIERGAPRWDSLRALLAAGTHPSRTIEENLADLRAAVAANQRGAAALQLLAGRNGRPAAQRYMDALADRAERLLRAALGRIADGRRMVADAMDDGTPIRVAVTVEGDSATIDFTGSGATHTGNLNATPAIVASATLYVLRLLIDEPAPLNEGLLRPIRLILPEDSILSPRFSAPDGSLLAPEKAPAVVGGNVETSQRVVDVLIRAFGLGACSQGTMNNLLFGDETFGYYETICGGAGAGPGFAGANGVHTHMTNTRITDPEIIEHRYPVRVERFELRRGSGGAGAQRGGDGVVRELTFLRPLDLSLLTQRRTSGPPGAEGGEDGRPGRQTLIRNGGEDADGESLPPIAARRVEPGDRLIVETPGGGGWGEEQSAS